ncbi:hypothetical protein PSU4_61010 [Pseudonocardia sulfidoxydans NBRC 16205]|uniref:Uncharacterized protein n=1 Tax=Pseudonocardia sulfidoxydans NBRC 16205 TaxID=1223511 RepID=A0A511DS70_9PSEU|nr:hypothetical protein PSU4_61010 [Pseudonocardia sulfidoxydans NBRC 16205]
MTSSRNAEGTCLRLGPYPVLLPEPLAELVRRLIADPRYRRNTAANARSRWLFPGATPGCPIRPQSLQNMLRNIGIDPRPARAGTWLQLVRQAPPSVLADALGLSPTAAMHYARLAGTGFSAYATRPGPVD